MVVLRVSMVTILVSLVLLEPQQTVYWSKDRIYDTSGRELAVAVPLPADQTAPSIPSTLTSSEVNPQSTRLDWGASTDTGGSGLAGYVVYRGLLPVGTVGPSTLTFTDDSLQPNTSYTYTVRAFDNAENRSGASNSVNVTTTTNSATDDFDRPNGQLGSNWVNQKTGSTDTGTIYSNALADEDAFTSRRAAHYVGATFNSDQYSQIYVTALPKLTAAATVRMQSGNVDSYYAAGFDNNNFTTSNGTEKCRIWKWINGSVSSIAVDITCHVFSGDTLKLTVSGTTLTFYKNGTQVLTVTDSSLSGGSPGYEFAHNASNVVLLDNWAGGSN